MTERNRSDKDEYFKNIPGYYYDEKKKRLFKLAGNQFSNIPGLVTKAKIEAGLKEEKRITDLAHFACNDKRIQGIKNADVLNILNNRQYHSKVAHQYNHTITSSFFGKLRCHGYLDDENLFSNSHDGHVKKMAYNSSYNKLVAFHEGADYSLFHSMSFKSSKNGMGLKKDENCEISNGTLENICLNVANSFSQYMVEKIIDFVWDESVGCIIFAKELGFTKASYIYFQKYMADDRAYLKLQISEYMICGTWCDNKKMLAVGVEGGVKFYNVPHLQNGVISVHKFLKECKQQVHAIKFSRDDNLLYYGNLKGQIKFYDIRQSKPLDFIISKERIRVDNFYESDDTHYLTSSFSNGQIVQYDVRMRRPVLDFEGHKNDCMKIPIHVNSTEEFLATVGTDCYTRIWDFRNGKLLNTIPPPLPSSRRNMPAICFLPQMSHTFNNIIPGLFLSLDNKLFVYS